MAFEAITSADLENLVQNKVAESLLIEYKRDAYGHADEPKKEALKDIVGLANASGGHLVIGIDEANGVPIAVPGIDLNIEKECAWLENICLSNIEPRIIGLQIRAVALANGRFAIVVRVPKSWNPPHAVTFAHRRFFPLRHSASTNEASMEELRALFAASNTLQDRIRAFRSERLRLIAENQTPANLSGEGRLILHIVPFSAFGTQSSIDIESLTRGGSRFHPLGSSHFNPIWNFDGYLAPTGHAYGQIFRNGIIEGVRSGILSRSGSSAPSIHAFNIEDYVLEAIDDYVATLVKLRVPPPFAILMSLLSVRGASVIGNPVGSQNDAVIRQEDLLFPEIFLSEPGKTSDYRLAARPLFDALWNAGGYQRSFSYDQQGHWNRR